MDLEIKRSFHKFFSSLSPIKPPLAIPNTALEIGDYCENFERAAQFTRSCGFGVKRINWFRYDMHQKIEDQLQPALAKEGIHDFSKSATQCLKWSHFLAPLVEKSLGCKVWPTVGQIWKDNTAVFNPSWDDLRKWSDGGLQPADFNGRSGMNIHSWLTLETGEIIEPSYLSSLSLVNPATYGAFKGGIAWGRDPDVLNNHRYFPMAVGSEFIESISNKSCMQLIAKNLNELNLVQAMMFLEKI